ncbi:hypothetical protein RZS08_16080, partial [Arthrospira platensis SPKY1]|nr:hypothetical protein [Arthrospira platensis SPKY1]
PGPGLSPCPGGAPGLTDPDRDGLWPAVGDERHREPDRWRHTALQTRAGWPTTRRTTARTPCQASKRR